MSVLNFRFFECSSSSPECDIQVWASDRKVDVFEEKNGDVKNALLTAVGVRLSGM